MADEGFKRKLAAILSADVEGYSRLMDDDEEATVRTLTAYRTIIADLVQQFRGRIVDTPGDNILAEFSSVVDAVNCGVKIQGELAERNADLPDERKMQFRIGVNLGDVIDEEERIYGDGVNIAARIESLSEAGGICISHSAYDQIKNKLKLGYEYLGDHKVKNIREPVKAYRVLIAPEFKGKFIGFDKKTSNRRWIWVAAAAVVVAVVVLGIWQFYMRRPTVEPASVEKMALPLPDKPSIAVLPFDNMSGDPNQEYFSDGLTEEIISALSKTDQLFVIARNSTFTYKGKPVKVKQVAEELGVRYVLEGSVRKSEDRVRITAQLIDATKGYHLWSERYDRDLKDIFALQDEITMKIVTALQVKLTEGEQARIWSRKFKNLDVYFKAMEALSLWRKGTKEGLVRFGQLGQEIVDTEPESPIGYRLLGWYNYQQTMRGISPQESIKLGFEMSQKALSLDEYDSSSHALLASIYLLMREYEKAIASGKRAVELSPNEAMIHALLGNTFGYAGRLDEAIAHLKQAIRLNPFPAYWYYLNLSRIYWQKGHYEAALTEVKEAVQRSPDSYFNYMVLAAVYASLDRQEAAEATSKKVLEINPNFSIEIATKALPFKPADLKLFRDALYKAGLPYTPPLPLPDKPSIAVLAFDNLSGDTEQEYFSDGIAENIITALSKVGELFVIARNSSFTYKGKPVKVQQVSRELGVRYVLEGSVQKSGDRVRITAQLIDAKNGQHLWAENYDRDFKDIFKIQDEITMKIVTALRVKLTVGEGARILAKQNESLDVYLKQAQANSLWNQGTKEALMRYGQLAQEIIDAEPEYPTGYRLLSWYHYGLAGYGDSPQENLKKAFALSRKTLAMDESNAYSHALSGYIYRRMRKYEKAIEAGKRSVELQPNGAFFKVLYGNTLNSAGRVDEGIAHIKQAIRLNPFPAYYYYSNLGLCYLQKGQYEDALKEFKKALQRAPEAPHIHGALATTYILLDREEEARASAAKSMELAPYVSVSMMSKTLSIKNQAYKELILDAMRKAGFPE
jgi:adenylate cyclase